MAAKIQFVITAQDQASGPIGKVKGAIQRLGDQVKRSKLSSVSDALTGGISSGSGAVSAVSKFMTGSNLAVGAIAGLVVKLALLESQWASSVRSMNNLGIRTGLPTTTAYGVQYAGRLAGLSAEQANSGMEQVRQTYSDALNNRNPEALKRYQAAGISTDPARMESIESVLQKLAAYSEALRAQGKYGGAQNFLNAAGAGSLGDFLNRGPSQVAADLQAAKNYIPTDDDIRRAREYADESARLEITYDRLRTTVLTGLQPALDGLLNSAQFFIDATSGRTRPQEQPNGADSTQQRIWDGFERFGNHLRGRGDETAAQARERGPVGDGAQQEKARSMVEWYLDHGLSREQAIGMTANAFRESSLDPRASNDSGHVGLFQWDLDRQKRYQQQFGRPLALASREEQMGYSLWELQHTEAKAGQALLQSTDSASAATRISSLYERPGDANEDRRRADIARGLDSTLGQASGSPGKMQIEIVHKNAPPGTSVNVSSTPGIETTMKTDRQDAPLGDQYAYSPGNF